MRPMSRLDTDGRGTYRCDSVTLRYAPSRAKSDGGESVDTLGVLGLACTGVEDAVFLSLAALTLVARPVMRSPMREIDKRLPWRFRFSSKFGVCRNEFELRALPFTIAVMVLSSAAFQDAGDEIVESVLWGCGIVVTSSDGRIVTRYLRTIELCHIMIRQLLGRVTSDAGSF